MSDKLTTLPTTGLIVIKDNKLLLAFSNNKKAWYLPGGKIDKNESVLESLQREVQEELNILIPEAQLKYYCHISAPAYGELDHIIMEQDCFLYQLDQEIRSSNEIGAVKFFDLSSYHQEPVQVPGVLLVFKNLKRDNLLN